MLVALFIGLLALLTAVVVVVAAVRRHQHESADHQSSSTLRWADAKEAFTSGSLREVRHEAALLSQPKKLDSDVGVGEIFTLSEEGSGYVEPRDIIALLGDRE